MTSAKKILLAVSGGLVAFGIVLVALGFALSGFDTNVFTTTIDMRSREIMLGGVAVDDPHGLPLLEQFAELGDVRVSAPSAPTAPKAPGASSPLT